MPKNIASQNGGNEQHKQLVKATLQALSMRNDVYAWSNNTGALRVGDRFVRFGHPGSSDILGVTSDGRIFCAEIKTGKAYQSKQQKEFEKIITLYGGRYFLVKDCFLYLMAELDSLNLKKLIWTASGIHTIRSVQKLLFVGKRKKRDAVQRVV